MPRAIRATLLIATLYFTGDLLGAYLAVGELYEASVGGLVLLSVALLNTLFVGLMVGLLAHFVTPKTWRLPSKVRLPLATLALLVITAVGYGARVGRQVTELPQRPEVTAQNPVPTLWIMIDTLRRDTLYTHDGDFPLTPKLKRWSQNALVFDDVESTAGWTIPSISALMTGVHNTTMDASAGSLPDPYHTTAEYLRGAGYQTHALVDNVIVEPRAGFGAGFETFRQRSAFRFVFTLPAFRLLPRVVHDKIRSIWPTAYDGATDLTDRAIRTINKADATPLFLYVHYMDPHAPYYPHPEIAPDPPHTEDVDYYHFRDVARADVKANISPGQLARLEHRYRGEVSFIDSELDRLLTTWQERFGDNTLVMLTSDHGEEFLDHGHLGHGHTLHREIVNVPLLIQFPQSIRASLKTEKSIRHPLSQIDILPTTLEVLGIPQHDNNSVPAIQGQSWLSWLRGQEKAPSRPLIASHSRHGRRTYRYRSSNDVYIKTMFYSDRPTERFFFDLSEDPLEKNNLSESKPDRLIARHKQMSQDFETAARALRGEARNSEEHPAHEDREALRAIGYIQ